MKNSKLFPFERNQYYYGKLLSVNDFEMEQKYMNDKRRTINRLLFGSGVAAGMYVLQVDDNTISIERGLALDYSGREILIDEPIVQKLSLIEGFGSYEELHKDRGYLYLCLEYAERQSEPVYHIVGKNTANSAGDYNKIQEGYRLFLTDQEPENDHLSIRDWYMDTQTIYWGNGIRIRQSVPRFARSGHKAQLKIEVENMGQQQLFSFSYDLSLSCMSYEGKSDLRVTFQEAFFEKSGRYEVSYLLDVHDVKGVEGVVEIDEDSFRLSVEQRQLTATAQGRQTVQITTRNEIVEMQEQYYQNNMETFLRNDYQQSIYLAKISLLQAGETYVIQKVENMPFQQYVPGSELNAAAQQMLLEGPHSGEANGLHGADAGSYHEYDNGLKVAEGETVLYLGQGATRGKRFFSGEIVHGLGVGQAFIVLSQVETGNTQVYGSSEVFEDQDPMVELAARLDRDKGSFVIGARVVEETMKDTLRVHWMAFKDVHSIVEEKKERRIFINPNVVELHIRETCYLEAVCSNMKDKRLKWSVRDNCGTVDNNGMYTAPNTTGVFEVTVQSTAYPEVKASAFVIVREAIEE